MNRWRSLGKVRSEHTEDATTIPYGNLNVGVLPNHCAGICFRPFEEGASNRLELQIGKKLDTPVDHQAVEVSSFTILASSVLRKRPGCRELLSSDHFVGSFQKSRVFLVEEIEAAPQANDRTDDGRLPPILLRCLVLSPSQRSGGSIFPEVDAPPEPVVVIATFSPGGNRLGSTEQEASREGSSASMIGDDSARNLKHGSDAEGASIPFLLSQDLVGGDGARSNLG